MYCNPLRGLMTYIIVLLEALLVLERVSSLRLLELHVPSHVALGSKAELSCIWELSLSDVLYSVKWYKDGKEFFRHVPKDLQSWRKFPLPGVQVEDSDLTGSNVTLGAATIDTEGRYRCEISGERPLFPTVSDHADMIVVALPDHGPSIIGTRPRYKVGDEINVSCVSGRSRPATQLSWFVNGEAASSHTLTTIDHTDDDGRITTSVKLKFVITHRHFKSGSLKLKCLATIGTIYWRSNEESTQSERINSYTTADLRKDNEKESLFGSSSAVQETYFQCIGCIGMFVLVHIFMCKN